MIDGPDPGVASSSGAGTAPAPVSISAERMPARRWSGTPAVSSTGAARRVTATRTGAGTASSTAAGGDGAAIGGGGVSGRDATSVLQREDLNGRHLSHGLGGGCGVDDWAKVDKHFGHSVGTCIKGTIVVRA